MSVKDYGAVGDGVTDDTPALAAAIAAVNGGTVVIPTDMFVTLKSALTVSIQSTTIRGEGFGSRIKVNFVGDAITVTAPLFRLENLEINQLATATRAGYAIVVGNAQYGTIQDVRVDGNATTPNNGIFFKSTGNGNGAGAWHFTNIICCTGGTAWQNFAYIANSSAVTTSTTFVFNNIFGLGSFTDAGIAVDGTIDTVTMESTFLANATDSIGPMLHVRNTVGGAALYPRWIHCNDCYFEAPTRTAIQLDQVRDFQFRGYIATNNVGVAVGASAVNVLIDGVHFANIQTNCVTVANGSDGTVITHSHFDECGVAANNTYDAVSVAANASGVLIEGNQFANRNANKPRYDIALLAGTGTNIQVLSNSFTGTTGTGSVFNGASGAVTTLGNTPAPAEAIGAISIGLITLYNGLTQTGGNFTLKSVTQATLGTPSNGTIVYCSDCNTGSACTAGGTGAFASRQNGAWKCL